MMRRKKPLRMKKNHYTHNTDIKCGCFIGDLCPCDNASLTMCLGGVRESSDEGDTCVLRVD